MSRVSLQTAHTNRVKVHRLRADGLSIRKIASTLNLSLGSVNNYLASPPGVSPADFLSACVELKREKSYLGSLPIVDTVCSGLGLVEPLMCLALVEAEFRKLHLPLSPRAMSGDHKRPFWFADDNISRSNDVWQLDTVKLVSSNGEIVEFLVVTDMFSRATWAVHLPFNGSEAHCLQQCFDVLGTPRVISADNGRGWPMDNSKTLSDLITAAFKAGVERFQFVPISTPEYNGRVERQNKTLKYRDWYHKVRYECKTVADVVQFVHKAVRQYNELYSHRAIGGRGKRNRMTPARLHQETSFYNPRENEAHRYVSFSLGERQTTQGIVSYIRPITRHGNAFVSTPELVFKLDRNPGAWYCRFDLHFGGRGVVVLFDPIARTGREIGTFVHPYGTDKPLTYSIDCGIVEGDFVPRRADDEMESLREQARQKRKGSRPAGYRAGGFRELPHPDDPDGYILVNRHGKQVHSSDAKYLADHSADIGLS